MAGMILERSKIDGTINDLGLIDDDIYALIQVDACSPKIFHST